MELNKMHQNIFIVVACIVIEHCTQRPKYNNSVKLSLGRISVSRLEFVQVSETFLNSFRPAKTKSNRCNVAHLAVRDSVELVSSPATADMPWITKVLAHHPFIVLIAVAVFSSTCIIVPFTTKNLPSFSDPTLGFETRGTPIAQRLTAWHNLGEAIRPSGPLILNPSEHYVSTSAPQKKPILSKLEALNFTTLPSDGVPVSTTTVRSHKREKKKKNQNDFSIPPDIVEREHANWTFGVNVAEAQPDNGNSSEVWKNLLDQLGGREAPLDHHDHDHEHISKDGFFCGPPSAEYSHVVITSTDDSDLLSLAALRSACGLETELHDSPHFKSLCQTSTKNTCCHSWALHNYVALLHGHTNCLQITEYDVDHTRQLLLDCASYYHNLKLPADCVDEPNPECPSLPAHCTKYNAVYNILHYLVDTDFLPPNNFSHFFVSHSMLFLPMARSSAMMPYYEALDFSTLTFGNVKVSAMDFGLKSTLFDDCLVRDTWLISVGAFFVFICMWLYTGSLFITMMTVVAIALSLGISYFLYTIVFRLRFFPFMNLLACVVAVGIGADDAFIYCKVWHCTKSEKKNASVQQLVHFTLHHAFAAMLVTSVTTAAAFFTSFISSITAIRCFSIFAGVAVMANFCLMVTWLPASVVVAEHLTEYLRCPTLQWLSWRSKIRDLHSKLDYVRNFLDRAVASIVVQMPFLGLGLLGCIALISAVLVLYKPGLQLPNSPDFQLFDRSHPLEKYDLLYRNQFWFERFEKHSLMNMKLPLRFVWGIKPVDLGNYMNPYSRGRIQFDGTFDLAAPESQKWLLGFCRRLRQQSFYQPTSGPLLLNCFLESMVSWMKRKCIDVVDSIDRSPCCETSSFPYTSSVFKKCVVLAMESLYRTSRSLFDPGQAGPRFSKNVTHPRIRAIVVEHDSNYSYAMSYQEMHVFYTKVEAWMQEELKSAPPGMRNGWFVSDLHFYDLQHTLSRGTIVAIIVSMAIALVVLLLVTLNILVSLFAIFSITSIIFVTVAVLLFLGWELNVLESVAISSAIGLAVDFSLHYSLNYQLAPSNTNREEAVKFALRRMGGPTAMGAVTTAIAGVFMLPSSVLAYIQIGVFLLVVMAVSWTYSTFFLMSLLCIAGPQHGFGQFSYSKGLSCFKRKRCKRGRSSSRADQADKSLYGNVLSESTVSASSTAYGLHVSLSETHELDALTHPDKRSSRLAKRSGSLCAALSSSRTLHKTTADQSPSANSACTVILCDDVDASRLNT